MGNPIEALLDINLPFRKAISRITSGVFYSFSFFSKKTDPNETINLKTNTIFSGTSLVCFTRFYENSFQK